MTRSHGTERTGPIGRTTVRGKGQITLPDEIRRAARLDEGDLLEVRVLDEGVIVLSPLTTVARSQAWFWQQEWQRREQEASADIAAGRVTEFGTGEELLRALEEPGS